MKIYDEHCAREDIYQNCPQTCRKTCCEDSKTFEWKGNLGKTLRCSWILKREELRKEATCAKSAIIRTKCPNSCGLCNSFTKPKATQSPTKAPISLLTVKPTEAPTSTRTSEPPSKSPTTAEPTNFTVVTKNPSSGDLGPTTDPSSPPTTTPTPTANPTSVPTTSPSTTPTPAPTASPTPAPTVTPTTSPTAASTPATTASPTMGPTKRPTTVPTVSPITAPTTGPTTSPTPDPTASPTAAPTVAPTTTPIPASSTVAPTTGPTTTTPTQAPGVRTSVAPTTGPTRSSKLIPTASPTGAHTTDPSSTTPTQIPQASPTATVTINPTGGPTVTPAATKSPTANPIQEPSVGLTMKPSVKPICEVIATLSFDDTSEYDGFYYFHNDDLLVQKIGEIDACSLQLLDTEYCSYSKYNEEAYDGGIVNDYYYLDQEEIVIQDAAGSSFNINVTHQFTDYELETEYYDHEMPGELTLKVNGVDSGKKWNHDVDADIDTHVLAQDNYSYEVNQKYNHQFSVRMECSDQCECSFEKTSETKNSRH